MERPITTMHFTSDGDIEGLLHDYLVRGESSSWVVCSGKTLDNLGVNNSIFPDKRNVNIAVFDNRYLKAHGIGYICSLANRVVLITQDDMHPANWVNVQNIDIEVHSIFNPEALLDYLHLFNMCDKVDIIMSNKISEVMLEQHVIDNIDIICPITTLAIQSIDVPIIKRLIKKYSIKLTHSKLLDSRNVQLFLKYLNQKVI